MPQTIKINGTPVQLDDGVQVEFENGIIKIIPKPIDYSVYTGSVYTGASGGTGQYVFNPNGDHPYVLWNTNNSGTKVLLQE